MHEGTICSRLWCSRLWGYLPATVVAPISPEASTGRISRLETLAHFSPCWASAFSWASSRPMQHLWFIIAIVAGTAPPSRTVCSTRLAVSRFCGYGMPASACAASAYARQAQANEKKHCRVEDSIGTRSGAFSRQIRRA